MRFAVCDDSFEDRNRLSRLLRMLSKNDRGIVIEYSDPKKLAEDVYKGIRYDALFLDIEMPEVNGISLAKTVKQLYSPMVCFVTSHQHLVFKSFECNGVFDYIVKPFEEERVKKVYERMLSEYTRFNYVVKGLYRDKLVELNIKDVIRIEQTLTSIIYYTKNEQHVLPVAKLSHLRDKYSSFGFIQGGRNWLINLNYVSSIEGEAFLFKDGSTMKMSRRMKPKCRTLFFDFLKEHSL